MADIKDITTGVINGSGYFDKFMDAINVHLDNQYKQGYIKGTDYANVYLGSLQAALSQAVAYVSVVEQVRASGIQTGLQETQSAKDIEVKDEQIRASGIQTDIAEEQSTKDLLLKQEQIDASLAKRTAEVALLNQKRKTEEAQINDTVDGVTVAGAIGTQKALQAKQTDGFTRDAEQKAAKILMDAWSAEKAVSGDLVFTPDGARNDDIEDVLIKLREGIGVTSSIYKLSADAGDDISVTADSVIILDATNSTAPTTSGDPTTYLWEFEDATGNVLYNFETTPVSGGTLGELNAIDAGFNETLARTVLKIPAQSTEPLTLTGSTITVKLTVEYTDDEAVTHTDFDYMTITIS